MQDPLAVSSEDVSLLRWILGILMTAMGSALGVIYTKHEKDFDKLEARLDKKADQTSMDKDFNRGTEQFDRIISEIQSLRSELKEELALRPTREEVELILRAYNV